MGVLARRRGSTMQVRASCASMRTGKAYDLLRVYLVAKGARRVHTRLTSINRPIVKSHGCKSPSIGRGFCDAFRISRRLLRTCHLRFPSKEIFATPVPRVFGRVVRGRHK